MKTIRLIVLCAACISVAAGQTSAADSRKAAKKPAPIRTVAPITIPADAEPTGDGSFRYTDKDGRKWLYRNTPFGVSKVEDKPAPVLSPEEAAKSPDDATKAFDAGEKVRFERPGPFGTSKWERKKTELTASEQAIWDRERQKLDAQKKVE